MRTKTHARLHIIAASAALLGTGAQADTGTLLLTGGVSTIEGAAGGGLSPWVVIGSNATQGEIGGSAYLTNVGTKDYGLNVYGARLELKTALSCRSRSKTSIPVALVLLLACPGFT